MAPRRPKRGSRWPQNAQDEAKMVQHRGIYSNCCITSLFLPDKTKLARAGGRAGGRKDFFLFN